MLSHLNLPHAHPAACTPPLLGDTRLAPTAQLCAPMAPPRQSCAAVLNCLRSDPSYRLTDARGRLQSDAAGAPARSRADSLTWRSRTGACAVLPSFKQPHAAQICTLACSEAAAARRGALEYLGVLRQQREPGRAGTAPKGGRRRAIARATTTAAMSRAARRARSSRCAT